MEILKQFNNKLLNREEITLSFDSITIPSKLDIRKQISEKTKKPEENIVIQKISTQFGNHTMEITAKIYSDVESKDKYETLSKKERVKKIDDAKKAVEEAKKATETPAEEPKPTQTPEQPAETPAEEPKPTPEEDVKKPEPAEPQPKDQPVEKQTEEVKEKSKEIKKE